MKVRDNYLVERLTLSELKHWYFDISFSVDGFWTILKKKKGEVGKESFRLSSLYLILFKVL